MDFESENNIVQLYPTAFPNIWIVIVAAITCAIS